MQLRQHFYIFAAVVLFALSAGQPASAYQGEAAIDKLFDSGRTECCSFTAKKGEERGVGCLQLTREEAVRHCHPKSCDTDTLTEKWGANDDRKVTGGCAIRHLRICTVGKKDPFGECSSTRQSDEIEKDVKEMFPD